ncbi:MAG: Rieske 2Fe-2S domain-containing protein [Verrucomicrobiales bacterium]|nr:Rieske 2Fe-2S domain-containing protein [Verrucomicrobiales bacterium]
MSDETDFQTVGPAHEIAEDRGRGYQVNGRRIAVIRHGGDLFALDEMCTHADASLAFGPVQEGRVMCPWHYAEFDLQTGEACTGPACEGVNTYPVRERDGNIEVAVPKQRSD